MASASSTTSNTMTKVWSQQLKMLLGRLEAACLSKDKCSSHPSFSAISKRYEPNSFHFRNIAREEVLRALQSINPHKATGFDLIPPRVLKLVSEEIAIFNQVKKECVRPKKWTKGEWVPVYKKEDRYNVANYTPVTKLDKIFEQLLCHQLVDKFDAILDPLMSTY